MISKNVQQDIFADSTKKNEYFKYVRQKNIFDSEVTCFIWNSK